MISNYIKIAVRNLIKYKAYSSINISGLAIGMAAAMLILLWVQHEITFDSFYDKTERIFRMYSRDNDNGKIDVWDNTSPLMGPELKQQYGEVEDAVRYQVVYFLTKVGDNHFNDAGAFADPGFLSMFNFPILRGPVSALTDNSGIVLTKKLAIKLFGNIDCLGQTVIVNDTYNFKVAAVLQDLPTNTGFEFEYLLPWNYLTRLGWDKNQSWGSTNCATYVLLREGSSQTAFDAKILDIVIKHSKGGEESTLETISHPLSKIHLYTKAENGRLTGGRIEMVNVFGAIAALILLVACINFMNLSTARSERRAKEVGVRKIVGARYVSLVIQFICESTILAGIAGVISVVMVQLTLGVFTQITGANIRIEFDNPEFWMLAVAFVLFTGLLAGSYPAFYLSSVQPIKVLKGTFKNGGALVTPRKVLVVLQFTFAIAMIIGTIIIRQQIQFAQNRDSGYERSELAYNFMQGDVPKNYDVIKNDLLKSGAVLSVSRAFSPITRAWGTVSGLAWQGSSETDKKTNFLQYGIDIDFAKTMGIHLIEGRDIDIETYPSDSSAMLLNEAAVNIMQLKYPIGEIIKDQTGKNWTVVGVIKDFIIESPYENVKPMVIQGWTPRYGTVHFRLNPLHTKAANLIEVGRVFMKHNPEYPFEYYFADEFYERKFGNEKQANSLASLFTVLIIFISCLGLFGLASFIAEQRTKEIGVRKVLGASTVGITLMISKEFTTLVLISFLVASPIAWYITNNWLRGFVYRVPINAWVFIVSGLLCILVALLTVGYQAIKAAVANPVKSLRSE